MKADEALETYPIQFRDKIDEYLWKEHNILGGCCSSIESVKYSVAREVTEKLTEAFIEKACEWIEDNINEYTDGEDIQFTSEHTFNIDIFNQAKFIDDFKNYMKGE